MQHNLAYDAEQAAIAEAAGAPKLEAKAAAAETV